MGGLLNHCVNGSFKLNEGIVKRVVREHCSFEQELKTEPSYKDKQQYFTSTSNVNQSMQHLLGILKENGEDVKDFIWIEPSAGAGAFVDYFNDEVGLIAMDIEIQNPNDRRIFEQDFLTW